MNLNFLVVHFEYNKIQIKFTQFFIVVFSYSDCIVYVDKDIECLR